MMAVALVIGAMTLIAAVTLLGGYLYRRAEERRLDQLCCREAAIVLTYDDGPGSKLTDQLLDLLAEEDVQATFFVLGHRALERPEVVRRLVSEGHDVGSHTFDHANAWKTWPGTFEADTQKGADAVRQAGGEGRLFRPPYGKMTLPGILLSLRAGRTLGWWTVDSCDSWDRKPISEILSVVERQGGGVVLMHDFDRYDPVSETVPHSEFVLEMTRQLIAMARTNGLRILTLSELLRRGEAA